jgi:hypothetical protein
MANSSVALPFVASAQAPVLILALANGDGAVADVFALQQTRALDATNTSVWTIARGRGAEVGTCISLRALLKHSAFLNETKP